MMRSEHARRRLATLLIFLLGASATSASLAAQAPAAAAQGAKGSSSSQQFVDGIAAVVNKQVITLKQLNTEVDEASRNLKAQGIPIPDQTTLQRQVLQRMIIRELQKQEADRLGIKVSQGQLDRAVQTVLDRNRITLPQLQAEIKKTGMTWERYLDGLREEVRFDILRQRQVDSTINISDAEVDAFLRTQGSRLPAAPQQGGQAPAPAPAPAVQAEPRVLGLAQILVAVPESAPSSTVNELHERAKQLLAKVKAGADFAGLAASSSDGPQALEGGVLGVRPIEGWPDLFIQAVRGLKVGQVSDIIRSGQGFHILKVLTWGEPQQAARPAQPDLSAAPSKQAAPDGGPMIVTQTHARHILVRTNQVTSDEQAQQRLQQVRQRIVAGESFEDLARSHSDDVTAPQGGDLGWLSPGETVPAFEQVMNSLQPGQLSEPIKSPFGWHLIEVVERRNQDMGKEYQRMQARQILFQRRIEPAVDQWINGLYGQAYIENRLEPSANRSSGRR